MKFYNEICLCIGVASVDYGNDKWIGKKYKPFNYSSKTMIWIEYLEQTINIEIKRVRELKTETIPLVQNAHDFDQIHLEYINIKSKKSIQLNLWKEWRRK